MVILPTGHSLIDEEIHYVIYAQEIHYVIYTHTDRHNTHTRTDITHIHKYIYLKSCNTAPRPIE